ncbi:dipicolinate synthase subunit B [Ruminococcus sp.]|uniref:dipicolinate synthase subunit B n=1 Tax=Ruminococcus sp. TaxID=41978 RepID=UPI002C32D31D|nr:dipicolinate synthase subunit B [Ruminococcus sp.]HOA00579.1 dipicolinate synthase subunit B [Ruminococcus sp.]HOH87983.1 dipicolinate synthase subunit B [Ruminococcus sp.]
MSDVFRGLRIGYAVTASFCTFRRSFEQAEILREYGAELIPIMSEHAANISTRFGTAEENLDKLRSITGREVITTIAEAEPIGPKGLTDIMVVAPCTSNTAAKLAASITDTTVTMAVKSHLRSGKPVVLAIASNDSLLGSAKNIGELFNRKNYFFVPMIQDDFVNKPASLVAEFSMLPQAVEAAPNGIQLRPIIYHYVC